MTKPEEAFAHHRPQESAPQADFIAIEQAADLSCGQVAAVTQRHNCFANGFGRGLAPLCHGLDEGSQSVQTLRARGVVRQMYGLPGQMYGVAGQMYGVHRQMRGVPLIK